ncbi:NAD-specific glutamate dehydrogenase, large form [Cardiobacterium hominis]|uniref:NAD-specific glutamate dehydrogenase, large form n=1 Tax=Cardiobacterium hominis TaxID=2718 RepID=A0A1C3H6S4_9GAMM|nr:NAD-glutamate dehydrogenase domain-containing protein [Cardiobacterium hominis]SAM70953.1 NAD-specific glutamate dehydrogenase, large form [Cardiobacterium hominis]
MATGQKPHTDIHARLQSLGDWSARFAQTPDAAALAPFAEAFSLAYRDAFPPEDGVADAQTLQALPAEPPLALKLARGTDARQLQLKLYGRGQPASLSRVLPLLENIGFTVESVQPYAIAPDYWLQQYTLTLPAAIAPEAVESRLADAFRRIWTGTTDSDRLNVLLLVTTLDIGEIAVLRALGKYIIQAGAPYNYEQICAALNANPDAAAALIAAFHAKMRPQAGDATAAFSELQNRLQQVQSAEHEAILRWYFDLLTALLRTNYYQKDADGQPKNRLAFKFAARDIPGLPKPKPLYEIWVYSPKVEGVHLRGGKVARGGLRWSDRHADFRTEVLGLVKAQMVKNAIIVPVGSKGGFVVKNPPADRDAFMEAGKACYRTFIRGLLDLTDNLVEGKIVPPADTMRHDEDDPYLVVAADKGTAKFSDIANQIAAEYRFWLGDAFASGGSAGYDHKGIGITARGAWESVKRHFRLLGKNIQQDDTFTAIGIGDMSGDVFGNGMLLSANTRLLAAFNHLHIFIDPNPDPAASLAERERLFRLPRSTWADYNPALISQGGGVFARSDKTIAISPEMKAAFDIQEDSLPPTELISRLLKAPVDLIWNGGIGTYIKASDESHAQVGDRANDALRINGRDVRAKIIGEGGNLGMTQRGRIEAAQNGVRLNTDAIDNSGGVNCSDHEVNIKILLNQAIEAGELDLAARNALLAEMTDSVAAHVLRQNYLQPQTLSLALARRENLDDYARLMQQLEAEDRLDRAIENLPDDASLGKRRDASDNLTAPELAVLLAYSKMWLYDHLLASNLPDAPYHQQNLRHYFPAQLAEKYSKYMATHRLHREITSTWLTNDLVNRLGIAATWRASQASGDLSALVNHYTIARETSDAEALWQEIEAQDNRVPATLQIQLELRLRDHLERSIEALARHGVSGDDLETTISQLQQRITALLATAHAQRGQSRPRDKAAWQNLGLPEALAARLAALPLQFEALNTILAAKDDSSLEEDWQQPLTRLVGQGMFQ